MTYKFCVCKSEISIIYPKLHLLSSFLSWYLLKLIHLASQASRVIPPFLEPLVTKLYGLYIINVFQMHLSFSESYVYIRSKIHQF